MFYYKILKNLEMIEEIVALCQIHVLIGSGLKWHLMQVRNINNGIEFE